MTGKQSFIFIYTITLITLTTIVLLTVDEWACNIYIYITYIYIYIYIIHRGNDSQKAFVNALKHATDKTHITILSGQEPILTQGMLLFFYLLLHLSETCITLTTVIWFYCMLMVCMIYAGVLAFEGGRLLTNGEMNANYKQTNSLINDCLMQCEREQKNCTAVRFRHSGTQLVPSTHLVPSFFL